MHAADECRRRAPGGDVGAQRDSSCHRPNPLPRFRFPFGDYDARTLNILNDMGYAAVGWTVDTLGWKGTSAGVTVARITARVAQNRAPGEIVLMHIGASPDGSTLDADALPKIIVQARSAGYTFVSITAP